MDINNKEVFQSNDEYCGECGCGVDCNEDHDHEHVHELHDFQFGDDEDYGMIHLTLDDDTELDCVVLGIFEVDEDEYIALLPEGDDEVLLYRYKEHDYDDEFDLFSIEDDEEFATVAEAFELLFMDDEEHEVHHVDEDEFVEFENYDDLED